MGLGAVLLRHRCRGSHCLFEYRREVNAPWLERWRVCCALGALTDVLSTFMSFIDQHGDVTPAFSGRSRCWGETSVRGSGIRNCTSEMANVDGWRRLRFCCRSGSWSDTIGVPVLYWVVRDGRVGVDSRSRSSPSSLIPSFMQAALLMMMLIRHIGLVLGLAVKRPPEHVAVRSVAALHNHVEVLFPEGAEVSLPGVDVHRAVVADEAHVRSRRVVVVLVDD